MESQQLKNTPDQAAHAVPENGGPFLEEDEISLLDLLVALVKHKRMIILTVVASAILSCVVALIIPNRYTATTTLLPPQQQTSLSAALASQLGGLGALGAVAGKELGLKNPNDIYVGMLKSRVVADALIQQLNLMEAYRKERMQDARERLAGASDIVAGKDGLIIISVEDRESRRAAAIANGYVAELQKLTGTLAVTEAAQRRLFFGQQLQKAKDDLANAEVALKQTQQKTGLIQLDSQAAAIIESVTSTQAQIAAKEVQLQAMQSYATDQNPNLVLLRQELSGLYAQLAKLEKQRNSGGGDIRIPTAGVPEVGLEYIRRLRDVKYYETIFELLAKQFEAAKIDEAREGFVIQVVDPAVEPEKKSFPPRTLIVLGVTLLAFFGASFWAILSESMSRNADPKVQQQLTELRGLLPWAARARSNAP